MKIGLARVSTREQHPEAQEDAWRAAGCEKVFTREGRSRTRRCTLPVSANTASTISKGTIRVSSPR